MSDIEELNKKNSLGFIKNAIEIVCKNKKSYYFTGFGDREGVFDLISGIWKGGAPNKPKPKTNDECKCCFYLFVKFFPYKFSQSKSSLS